MAMGVLIDGYNLLNAVGIVGPGTGPGSLKRSRLALLNFLVESLEPDQIPQTSVVFDAKDPPRGSPRVVQHRGLTVRFAAEYEDADALIEELIRADPAPRRLVVVSSDRRVQRAARRRRAAAVESHAWYAGIVRRRRRRREAEATLPARPALPLLEEDIEYWIHQFGGESALADLIEEESAEAPAEDRAAAEGPTGEQPPEETRGGEKPTAEEAAAFEDVFPPGYAEDLLQDEEARDPYDPFPPGYGEDLEGH